MSKDDRARPAVLPSAIAAVIQSAGARVAPPPSSRCSRPHPGRVPAAATAAPRPHIRAVRTPKRPRHRRQARRRRLALAPPPTSFTQHFPDEGAPPSERTEVRVLYDDDAIYIGIDCEQVHSPVVKRLMRRDTPLPSDGVWIDIDSRATAVERLSLRRQRGRRAAATPSTSTTSTTRPTGTPSGRARSPTRRTATPSSCASRSTCLRFDALPVQDWGLEVRRVHRGAPGDRRLGVLPAQRRAASSRSSAASTTSRTCARDAPGSCARSSSGRVRHRSADAVWAGARSRTAGTSASLRRPRRQGARDATS